MRRHVCLSSDLVTTRYRTGQDRTGSDRTDSTDCGFGQLSTMFTIGRQHITKTCPCDLQNFLVVKKFKISLEFF